MKKLLLIVLIFFTGCTHKYATTEVDTVSIPKYKTYSKQKVTIGWSERGIASWYGLKFHGNYTSSGEIYNMYAFTAAHKTLPMNTIVKVTNLNNGKSVIVRINDRGPFVKGRIIDLSYAAAKKIGLDKTGIAPVKIIVIGFKSKTYISEYMIQVGAFLRKNGAEFIAKRYKRLGYNTKILKRGGFYKIFIVGFKSYAEAKKFKLSHKLNGFIVGE